MSNEQEKEKEDSQTSTLSRGRRFYSLNRRFLTRSSSVSPLVVAVALVLAFAYGNFLLGGNPNSLLLYFPYFIWIILAESWNVAGGYAGLLNLGLVAFFGLGAFISGICMALGMPYFESLLVAALGGAFLGMILIPTFRLKTEYFAIGTLVVPFIVKPIAELIGRNSNYATPAKDILGPVALYDLGLFLTALSIFSIFFLMRSRIGIALRAVGDDEVASASLGVNILQYKTVALVMSGVIAALAGGFFIQHLSFNTNEFEDLTYSLFPIFMVIVGGIGTFEGPIVGALIFSLISYTLNVDFPGTAYDILLFSVVIVVVAVLVPKGLVPSLARLITRIRNRRKSL